MTSPENLRWACDFHLPRRGSAARIPWDDAALALLRDLGPSRTRDLCALMPTPSWPGCGHCDCTRPEHQQRRFYRGVHATEMKTILDGLVKQGKVVRSFSQQAGRRPVLWALALDVPDTIDAEAT